MLNLDSPTLTTYQASAAITRFLGDLPRNKVVACAREMLPLVQWSDVGYLLASHLNGLSPNLYQMAANDWLQQLLFHPSLIHPEWGPYVALTNRGILDEPALHINFDDLLDKASKHHLILLDKTEIS